MRDLRSRNRPRRSARHRFGVWAESLESRRLLATSTINVAAGLVVAVALPVPGLAPTSAAASTIAVSPSVSAAQTAATVSPSVSPAPAPSPFGPSVTGPSTTLSPLMDDSETAAAPASEVARPTPGRSDRISSYIEAPEIELIQPLRSPDEAEGVIPGPEVETPPAAPAPAPVPPIRAIAPADPAPAPRPADPAPAPAPAPKPVPEEAAEPIAFRTWDAAVELVATDEPEVDPAPPVQHAEVSLAAGALLAAWGGWKYGSRVAGRSRRRPIVVPAIEAGPGSGDGR